MTQPAQMPLALAEVAIKAHESHIAQLTHRIGTYRAMADEKMIEAMLCEQRKQTDLAAAARKEATELGERLAMMQGRVAQLVAEFGGQTQAPATVPVSKKPWHKKGFWQEAENLQGWLAWLEPKATAQVSVVGGALGAIRTAWALLSCVIRDKEASDVDVLMLTAGPQLAAQVRGIQSLPFYLFVPKENLQEQVEMSFRFAGLVKACEFALPIPTREEVQAALVGFAQELTLSDIEKQRLANAIEHFESGDMKRWQTASQIIAGMSPPDHLRFVQQYLIRLMQDAFAASQE